MARQCWDEARHCEISVKLGDWMGTEIGEFAEATFLYEAACNPDPVLRLTGVNRALEGLAIDVFNTMREFGDDRRRPGARVLRGLDARRRGHPREDGLRLAAPPHRRTTPSGASEALEFQRIVDKLFSLGGFRGEEDDSPIQLARRFRELAGFDDDGDRRDRRARRPRRVDGGPQRQAAAAAARRRPGSLTPWPRHRHPRDRSRWSTSTRPTIAALVERAGRARSGCPPTSRSTSRSTRRVAARPGTHRRRSTRSCSRSRAARFEDPKHPRQLSEPRRPTSLGRLLLPGRRPARPRLRRRRRTTTSWRWPTGSPGTSTPSVASTGSGYARQRQRWLYHFRNRHGFTDVADRAFERLWTGRRPDVGRHRAICADAVRRAPPIGACRQRVPARAPPDGSAAWSVEVVGADRVEQVDLGRRGAAGRRRPSAISIISAESKWARWASGDSHFSITTKRPGLGGRGAQVDVAAARVAPAHDHVLGQDRGQRARGRRRRSTMADDGEIDIVGCSSRAAAARDGSTCGADGRPEGAKAGRPARCRSDSEVGLGLLTGRYRRKARSVRQATGAFAAPWLGLRNPSVNPSSAFCAHCHPGSTKRCTLAKERVERDEEDLVRLYLTDIGQYPLLTKDDEVRLAQAIEARQRGPRAELEAAKDAHAGQASASCAGRSATARTPSARSCSRTCAWSCRSPRSTRRRACRCSTSSRRATSA